MARNITRWQIIAAAPALAAIPVAAMASEPEDQTFALIEAHRAAERAYNAANDATDIVLTGRPGTDEEWAAVNSASDALDAASIALCEYAPTTLAGSRAKVDAILNGYIAEGSEFDGATRALVRSIAQMVRA